MSCNDPATWEVRVFNRWEALAPFRSQWAAWGGDHFMNREPWLRAWWEHQPDSTSAHRQLAWCGVFDPSQRLRGFFPGYLNSSFTGRSLRMLGDGKACTDYVTILSEPHRQTDVGHCLGTWLGSSVAKAQLGPLDWVEIEGHREHDLGWSAFWNGLAKAGWHRRSQNHWGTWALTLPKDFETFYASIPKSRRRKVNKALRLWEQGHVEFCWHRAPETINAFWPEFVRLHQLRRNQRQEAGCFAEPRFRNFLEEAWRSECQFGHVQIAELRTEQRPIGALLFFCDQTRWSLYQSGFDPAYQHLEPGHLAITFAIQSALADGIREFDFLRGDEPYKAGWGANRHPLGKTRCTAPHWVAQVKDQIWMMGRRFNAWRKGLAPQGCPSLDIATSVSSEVST